MFDGGSETLRVGVLVDLERRDTAGGHVKCWERIAEAATRVDVPIDLSIHVQGDKAETIELSPRVRYIVRRPVLSTARWRSFDVGADHTDLAPIHPGVLRHARRYDVIHTTDAYFAYARTAEVAARVWNKPLVTSVHTDTPNYTRLYAERILRRLCPSARVADRLIDTYHLPDRLARGMQRKLQRHIRRADWTLVGAQPDGTPPSNRLSVLRRGIDRTLFASPRRDRAFLARTYGISPDTHVVLFVGRLDDGKGVKLLVAALQHLIAAGQDVVGLFAGRGAEAGWIAEQLGNRAILAGQVDREILALLYASADVFVLPSEIEISPNVVLEAKSSGLVPIVAPNGGGRFVAEDGADGIVIESRDPHIWSMRIAEILADDTRRFAMGRAARADVERCHPSWEQVVLEDLYPVWLRSAKRRARSADNYVSATTPYSRSAS